MSGEDVLYSRLNARGRKSFKSTDRAQLTEKFPEYGKVGLPAHKAALDGNVEALREIYTAFSADGVPSRDVNGATPLHLAVRGNRIETVRWLLRFTDLSPTTAAKHGETPCHVAAVLGNTECLKAMLGADMKGEVCVASDNSGFTTLHLAIVKSRNEVAKMLISELGAKGVGPANESGITAAHVAASSGNTEVLKIVASKFKKLLNQEAKDGTTPLYFAAQEGRLAAVKYLHEKGKCDLSSPSSDGRKPMHAACQCGHTHVIKYIVSQLNNSAIFETVPDGATTLHFAASTGQVKTARWLIDSDIGGTLVNMKDNSGDTPAHDAADNGQIETLKLLLESGADLYAINNDGNTPYSIALSNAQPGMANFVLSFASNAPQKQEEGPSQMTIFDMQGEVDVVNFGPAVTGPATQEVTVEAEVMEEAVGAEGGGGEGEKKEQEEKVPEKVDDKKAKKKKEKERKEKEKKEKKQKDKKGKKKSDSNSSFLGSTGADLLSLLPGDKPGDSKTGRAEGDDNLLMTESELDMFKENSKANDDDAAASAAAPKERPRSEGSDIIVSYGDKTPPVKSKLPRSRPTSAAAPIATPDYSTVSEITRAEEKKEKKKVRKSSKSIQTKKHKEESSKNVEEAGAILSGPQLGFKPQFRSNPLQHLSPAIPPTPPPTPATGFSSSAPSEAGMVSTTEDEDDTPYDVFTKTEGEEETVGGPGAGEGGPPPQKAVGQSEGKREAGEENKELLDNEITDLDDEEAEDHTEQDSSKREPPVLKKWPPPKEVEYKKSDVKIQPSGVNVLKKWKTTSSPPPPTSPEKISNRESRDRGAVLRKWPPAAAADPKPPSPKESTPLPLTKTPSPPLPSVPPPSPPPSSQPSDAEREHKFAVKLRPVQKAVGGGGGGGGGGQKSEPPPQRTKLKKASKGSVDYSSPGREATSGAGNELSAMLKRRQNKI